MPSSEKIISPGVFTNEIDQSFLPAAIGDIGAAVIGPTVKGPALVPTVITTYSEYQQKFGDSFKSGSNYFRYLTDHLAEQYLKHQGRLTVIRIMDGDYGPAISYVPTGSFQGSTTAPTNSWGSTNTSLKITTLADGAIMNSISSSGNTEIGSEIGSNNILTSGSKHNLRWQVTDLNTNKGTFSLLIRRGDDSHKRKLILESWNNISLDPNQGNFIEKVLGNSTLTLRGSGGTDPYLQPSGSYPVKSKYVRVEALRTTVDYIDENGNVREGSASGSLPAESSGAFHSATNGTAGTDAMGNVVGTTTGNYNFYENIGTQTQGLFPATANSGSTAYTDALNLLRNQDEYDINLIFLPGLLDNVSAHRAITTKAIDVCEDRGDCFVIIDPTQYGDAITTATTRAEAQNSNYAAMYYPWIQVPDNIVGTTRWVPPSIVMSGVYGFNDRVAHPWFAPAGLNRGGIDVAIQAERKLTHSNRDTLYDSNVNPIATFPGQGVVAWGQKTLQKKASALDRVNVRRLLIKLKKFIASTSRFLVFEQNNPTTRRRFLNLVNPFMEQVQSQSGLSAFRVVMDESNNSPDTIDRNILYGQIFVQPTRTAEFIVLDFTVQPTGATFPE